MYVVVRSMEWMLANVLFVFRLKFAETARLSTKIAHYDWNDIREQRERTQTQRPHATQQRGCTSSFSLDSPNSIQWRLCASVVVLVHHHHLFYYLLTVVVVVSIFFRFREMLMPHELSFVCRNSCIIVRDTTTTTTTTTSIERKRKMDTHNKCIWARAEQSYHLMLSTTQSMNEWRLDVVNISALLLFYYYEHGSSK